MIKNEKCEAENFLRFFYSFQLSALWYKKLHFTLHGDSSNKLRAFVSRRTLKVAVEHFRWGRKIRSRWFFKLKLLMNFLGEKSFSVQVWRFFRRLSVSKVATSSMSKKIRMKHYCFIELQKSWVVSYDLKEGENSGWRKVRKQIGKNKG